MKYASLVVVSMRKPFELKLRLPAAYDLDGSEQDVLWRAGLWGFKEDIARELLKSEDFYADRSTNLDYFEELAKEIGEEQTSRR